MSGITMILISSRFLPPLRWVCLVVLFLFFFFFPKSVRIEWSIRSLLRALVCVTMNVDSRQDKKARNFMFFCSYIIQFLLSFSKTIRRCYRMNEARFSLIHFFIIMTIYLFHCEELYGCLNFAALHSMRGSRMVLPCREGRYFFASPPESNVSCSISYTFI